MTDILPGVFSHAAVWDGTDCLVVAHPPDAGWVPVITVWDQTYDGLPQGGGRICNPDALVGEGTPTVGWWTDQRIEDATSVLIRQMRHTVRRALPNDADEVTFDVAAPHRAVGLLEPNHLEGVLAVEYADAVLTAKDHDLDPDRWVERYLRQLAADVWHHDPAGAASRCLHDRVTAAARGWLAAHHDPQVPHPWDLHVRYRRCLLDGCADGCGHLVAVGETLDDPDLLISTLSGMLGTGNAPPPGPLVGEAVTTLVAIDADLLPTFAAELPPGDAWTTQVVAAAHASAPDNIADAVAVARHVTS